MASVEHSLRSTLRATMLANIHGTEKDILIAMWDRIKGDTDMLHWLFEDWFQRAYREVYIVEHAPGQVSFTERNVAPVPAKSFSRFEVSDVPTRAAIDKAKSAIVDAITTFTLTSGRRLLEDATFGDCIKEGGWLAELGKRFPANYLVSRHVTLKEIMAVRQRFYG